MIEISNVYPSCLIITLKYEVIYRERTLP